MIDIVDSLLPSCPQYNFESNRLSVDQQVQIHLLWGCNQAAVKILKEQGTTPAQKELLGSLLVAENKYEAVETLREAGTARSYFTLGLIYLKGLCDRIQSSVLAETYIEIAAMTDSAAKTALAYMCWTGAGGVAMDRNKAMELLKQTDPMKDKTTLSGEMIEATTGINNQQLQVKLGRLHYFMEAESKHSKAVGCWTRALADGSSEAKYYIGLAYYSGKRVDRQDMETGIKLIREAASEGVEAAKTMTLYLEQNSEHGISQEKCLEALQIDKFDELDLDYLEEREVIECYEQMKLRFIDKAWELVKECVDKVTTTAGSIIGVNKTPTA